jgi:exodeoxyribonuclease-3
MKKIATNLTLDAFSIDIKSKNEIEGKSQSDSSIISSFCWNIGNPSIDRARKQTAWLATQYFDLLLLTECRNSEGCFYIEKYFQNIGYHVMFPKPENNEYGVMVISRLKPEISEFSKHMTFLSDRVKSVKIPFSGELIEIIVTYVPSRDASVRKKERKKEFLKNLLHCFKNNSTFNNRIFCGDLNILEPDHDPHYSFFENWEYDFYSNLSSFYLKDVYRYFNPTTKDYSWVGRTGDGYRYDHFFASNNLIPKIIACEYIHEPREKRLSDHSGLICRMKL